jgi:hypothetical protein
MQLWLRIFTASSTQLREDYSLFSNGPSNKAGAARDGIFHSYNRGRPCPLRPNCPYTHRCNRIGCGGTILGTNVHNTVGKIITTTTPLHNPPVAPRRPTENRTVSLKSSIYNSSNSISLDNTIVTPIRVDTLEDALCGPIFHQFPCSNSSATFNTVVSSATFNTVYNVHRSQWGRSSTSWANCKNKYRQRSW